MRCEFHREGLTPLCGVPGPPSKIRSRSLKTSPTRGRVVPEIGDPAVREIFVGSYRMIYEVNDDRVVILAFITERDSYRPIFDSPERRASVYTA